MLCKTIVMKLRSIRWIFFIFLAPFSFTFGQNLVPNGDMEAYTACPTSMYYYSDLATGWNTPVGHGGTSDYFNVCGDPQHDWTNFADHGTVTPHSGDGYLGMLTHSGFDQREYITRQLSAPLVAGQSYEVSFWVYNALGDYSSDLFCNNIGAYLSVNQPDVTGQGCGMCVGVLNVTPQVNESAVVINQWTQISCTIIAAGGEEWITIGNFFDNASTATTPNGALSMAQPPSSAYSFIDDVVVEQSTGAGGGTGIDAGADQTICFGSDATLNATAVGGGTITWTDITGTFGPITGNSITVSPTSTTTYLASVPGVCSNHFDTVIVNVLPTPTATISGGGTYCTGSPVPDIIVSFTGTGPWDFTYTDGSTPVTVTGITNSPYIISGAAAGTYSLLSTNDACPGTVSGSASITLGTPADATITNAGPFCENDPAVDLTANDVGGTWSGPGITDVSQGTFNPSSAGAGTHTIVYTIPGSCGDVDSVEIIVNPTDNAAFNFIQNIYCMSDQNPIPGITGMTDGTFSISAPGVIDPVTGEIDLQASGPGAFVVSYVTTGPCPITVSEDITVLEDAEAQLEPIGPFCLNDDEVELAYSPIGGELSGPGVDPATGIFNPSLAGVGTAQIIYTILGTCGDADTIYVDVYDIPSADAGANASIFLDEEVELLGSGGGSYLWEDASTLSCEDCPNPIASPIQSTVYTLTVTDENGCVDMDSVVVTVNEEVVYYIPNAFTPDGDEYNQTFRPVFTSGFDPYDFNLQIYNRWGQLIFASNDPELGWDGSFKGRYVQDGVYTWRIEFKEIMTDKRHHITGHVVMIR